VGRYTVGQDGNMKLFSLENLQQTHSAAIGDMSLACCLPLDDGITVIVGSWDNNVYVAGPPSHTRTHTHTHTHTHTRTHARARTHTQMQY
jgi:hypothetical protein